MMRYILAAAVLALAACGGDHDDSNVIREIQRAERQDQREAQAAAQNSDAFLAQVRAQPGVEAFPSGLLLERRTRGSNQTLPRPGGEAVVLVHYEGKLSNGSVFDSSFRRWRAGAVSAEPSGSRFLRSNPADAARRRSGRHLPLRSRLRPPGQPPVIPPGAALQFRIVLLAFQNPGGRIVQAPH